MSTTVQVSQGSSHNAVCIGALGFAAAFRVLSTSTLLQAESTVVLCMRQYTSAMRHASFMRMA